MTPVTEGMEVQVRDRTEEPQWIPPVAPTRITSPEEYLEAAEGLKEAVRFRDRVKRYWRQAKENAHATWMTIVSKEKAMLAWPEAYEAQTKRVMADYDQEQEALRVAEQRRLEEEARKAEEVRRLEEAAALEAEAVAEGDETKLAEAHEMVAAPIETPVVMVEKATPKVEGVSYRDKWDAKVVDFGKLIAFVAANPTFQNLLTVNQTALRQQAQSRREHLQIPGVKAFSTRVTAVRR